MRALITGIAGFAGSYLAEHLFKNSGVEVWGVSLGTSENWGALGERVTSLPGDLSDPITVSRILAESAPDQIFHLAAHSFPAASWQDPWATMENNIRAELNLLHACAESNLTARVLVVGSSDEYGRVEPRDLPLSEDTAFRPDSPYGVSKIAQDLLGLQYFISHQVQTVRVRPFNHIGPRQNERFVASTFAKQIAEIERGLCEPVLYVGNLDAQRDFTDVRDIVRGYALALDRGIPGEVYNIGSGVARSIRELLDAFLELAKVPIRVEHDPSRDRPSDVPVSVCNADKFKRQTGWKPEIEFKQTIIDILEYWRVQVQARQTAGEI